MDKKTPNAYRVQKALTKCSSNSLLAAHSHPAADIAAQAKCPPFSVLGSILSRNTGGCSFPLPPPPSNTVPSSNPSNPEENDRLCLGTSQTSRLRLCMMRTSRGSRARKATGTGGSGSNARGPCSQITGRRWEQVRDAMMMHDDVAKLSGRQDIEDVEGKTSKMLKAWHHCGGKHERSSRTAKNPVTTHENTFMP